MSLVTDAATHPATGFRVTRSRRNVAWTGVGALIVVVVLALFPYTVYSGTTSILVQGFIVLTMASMWNLLAGYAGLVSVGQQAFVGLGAYFVLILAIHGTSPFLALPAAAIGCGVAALVFVVAGIGTVVYMVLQQTLASYNAWYLIILGLVAIVVALFARRGLWGLVDSRLNLRLFPVGYWLRSPGGNGRRAARGG